MRLQRNLLWLAFIAISVFLWSVFFEYGWDPATYLAGAREDLSRIFSWLARKLDR